MKMTHVAVAAAAAVAGLSLAGCNERRITILSNPEGALVTMNGVELPGRTPVTVPFTWYGDYDIVLRYEREVETPEGPQRQYYYLHTHQRAEPPPHEWMGLDLFAELWPGKFKDHKVWTFLLEPMPRMTDEQLVAAAKELKGRLDEPTDLQRGKRGSTMPAPKAPPAATTTAPATTASQPAPATAPRRDGR